MSDFERDRKEILESAEKVLNKAHAIDCSLAVNFIKEYSRLCKTHVSECRGCPIHSGKIETENSADLCREFVQNNPQKAVEIVQEWSDEHPREKVVTRRDKLLEMFPNALRKGAVAINPCLIGEHTIECSNISCEDCRELFWSMPYKENTNGQD